MNLKETARMRIKIRLNRLANTQIAERLLEYRRDHTDVAAAQAVLITVAAERLRAADCLSDGFGNQWERRCGECGGEMQIVRPGAVQCPKGCGGGECEVQRAYGSYCSRHGLQPEQSIFDSFFAGWQAATE